MQTLPGSYPVTARRCRFPSPLPVGSLAHPVGNVSWSPLVLASTGVLTVVSWYAYGRKNYSGPIRAVTKWETGVEIDLASTLGPKSRPSDAPPTTGHGNGNNIESEEDAKHHIEGEGVLGVPTVTIDQAWSLESESNIGGQQHWTDVSHTSGLGANTGTGTDTGVHSRRSFENP